jgi:hypothetical protein
LQRKKLHDNQKQKKYQRENGIEQILPFLQKAHRSQRNKIEVQKA